MSIGFLAPKGAIANKPAHGKPCNACGLCCMAVLCPLAHHVFGGDVRRRCPALQMDGGKSSCGLVAAPERYAVVRTMLHGAARLRDAALHLIGSGHGCDARFNGEAADPEFYAKLRLIDHRTRVETKRAKRLWGFR